MTVNYLLAVLVGTDDIGSDEIYEMNILNQIF